MKQECMNMMHTAAYPVTGIAYTIKYHTFKSGPEKDIRFEGLINFI
jgi:hypothetical protein